MDKIIKQYQHITTESKKATIELTREQQALIFFAYDFGISELNDEQQAVLNEVISDLKNAIFR